MSIDQRLFSFLFGCFLSLNVFGQSAMRESIVDVYGVLDAKHAKAGTGFVINLGGINYILTAYHVINRSIKVDAFSWKIGQIDGLRIVGYNDTLDLAVLASNRLRELTSIRTGRFPSDRPPDQLDSAFTIGNPNNMALQRIRLHFTSTGTTFPGMLLANGFNDTGPTPVFKPEFTFQLIPMDMTVYNGMSGAPIIVRNVAVGVLSGSENIGAGLAWAIPTFYLRDVKLQHNLTNGIDLPDLRSLLNYSKGLYRASFTGHYNSAVGDKYSPLKDICERQARHAENVHQISQDLISLEQSVIGRFDLLSSNLPRDRASAVAKQLMDSIANIHGELDLLANERRAFFDAKRSFDETCAELIESWRESGGGKSGDTLSDRETRDHLAEELQIVNFQSGGYVTRLSQLESLKNDLPPGTPTASDLLTYADRWKRYFSLAAELQASLSDLISRINDEYQSAKIFTDRIFESLAYRQDSN